MFRYFVFPFSIFIDYFNNLLVSADNTDIYECQMQTYKLFPIGFHFIGKHHLEVQSTNAHKSFLETVKLKD